MSRNTVTIEGDRLVVEPRGLDKVWSFTRRLQIPLDRVKQVTVDPGAIDERTGWRGPGLRIPGKLSGTFHRGGTRQFWNVSGYERAVSVELRSGGRFDRLTLTVDNPQAVADTINRARAPR